MTYKKNTKKYIENYNLGIGDTIKVNKEDISYIGILLDRPEDADDGYLVLKFSSGYNIGVAIEDTTAELIKKGEKPKIGFEETKIPNDSSKQNISIISTGGTVSSVIDYRTGAVHPAALGARARLPIPTLAGDEYPYDPRPYGQWASAGPAAEDARRDDPSPDDSRGRHVQRLQCHLHGGGTVRRRTALYL